METTIIEYQGIEYKVEEPTIDIWNKLTTLKSIQDPEEFAVNLLAVITGLDNDDIMKADWFSIMTASNHLTDYLMKETKKFYNEFEFNNQVYRFIDLYNLTFGEFIDIDEFLRQPLVKRQSELHNLMALLYREVGEDGKLVEYNAALIKDRAELFRNLPVRYLNGALNFFLTLENILQQNTPSFSTKMRILIWIRTQRATLLALFGVGIHLSISWLKKIYSILKQLLDSLYSWFSTFLPMRMTSINKEKKSIIK